MTQERVEQVRHLYDEHGFNLSQIGERLNITAVTAGHYLSKARRG